MSLATVGSKRKPPPDSLPVAYPKSIRSQCKQRGQWALTLVQLRSLWRELLPLLLSLQTSRWNSREPLTLISIPYQLLPRAKEPARTLGSPWITLQVHNRSCSSPGLRVEEGVHAKILCFWVGGLKWRDEGGICVFRSGPATLPS